MHGTSNEKDGPHQEVDGSRRPRPQCASPTMHLFRTAREGAEKGLHRATWARTTWMTVPSKLGVRVHLPRISLIRLMQVVK